MQLIDQRFLPHRFVIEEVSTVDQMVTALRDMHVRGAGLIGASAGYGMYLGTIEAAARPAVAGFDQHLASAAAQLKATRPTAVNLSWAIGRQLKNIAEGKTAEEKIALALGTARLIAEEDEEHCRMIGQHGCSRIATRDGSRLLITVPRRRRSMPRTIAGCRFMSGLVRQDPGIRARSSLPGSWASTACRIR